MDDLAHILTSARPNESASRLMDLVYEPLRALAKDYFRRQPSDHTLQPTALVHEVFLRMAGKLDLGWQGRAHFFAACAKVMRCVLTDHARRRRAVKRGGDQSRVTLSCAALPSSQDLVDAVDLDQALAELDALSPRQARIVECRFFSGMTINEIAHALGVSKRTVDADWAMARAWLSVRLAGAD